MPTVLLVHDKEDIVTAHSLEKPSLASSPEVAAAAAQGRPSYREQMDAFERNLLSGALAASAGNQSEAARRLRLNRVTFYDRLRRHGLTAEPNRDPSRQVRRFGRTHL